MFVAPSCQVAFVRLNHTKWECERCGKDHTQTIERQVAETFLGMHASQLREEIERHARVQRELWRPYVLRN